MAQITYRANLGAKKFPLLSTDQGRTIIVKGQDQNYVAPATPREDTIFDLGIPQIYYAENVMPTSQGFQSVGFKTFVGQNGDIAEISDTFPLKDTAGNLGVLGFDQTTGKFYVLKDGSSTWLLVATEASAIGKIVSVGHAGGTSYIYISTIGCYVYDFTLNTFTLTTLTGLTAASIILICAISGYLLAFSEDAAAWSSTVDPTDFTPSLATGAGGGNVEGVAGKIVHVAAVYSGAIIFSSTNAVACTFADNARFPFRFTPITGSGGISTARYCSESATSGYLYAYTTSGLQTINLRQAKSINPDITDFISGEVIETFNSSTNELTQKSIVGVMAKRISFIADRYLIISYGEGSLNYAIVHDTLLDQYGKLAIAHLSCFEFTLYDQTQWETPKKSMAFIGANGKLSLVDFTFTSTHSGVIMLGKYQYVRSRMLQLEEVGVQSIGQGQGFELICVPSLSGVEGDAPMPGFLAYEGKHSRKYAFHSVGLNHSLIGKGNFDLNSLILTFTVHGGM